MRSVILPARLRLLPGLPLRLLMPLVPAYSHPTLLSLVLCRITVHHCAVPSTLPVSYSRRHLSFPFPEVPKLLECVLAQQHSPRTYKAPGLSTSSSACFCESSERHLNDVGRKSAWSVDCSVEFSDFVRIRRHWFRWGEYANCRGVKWIDKGEYTYVALDRCRQEQKEKRYDDQKDQAGRSLMLFLALVLPIGAYSSRYDRIQTLFLSFGNCYRRHEWMPER